jgi:hypothetical protein
MHTNLKSKILERSYGSGDVAVDGIILKSILEKHGLKRQIAHVVMNLLVPQKRIIVFLNDYIINTCCRKNLLAATELLQMPL